MWGGTADSVIVDKVTVAWMAIRNLRLFEGSSQISSARHF